jgi:hypothetical protein
MVLCLNKTELAMDVPVSRILRSSREAVKILGSARSGSREVCMRV